jgi:hypothetical protein
MDPGLWDDALFYFSQALAGLDGTGNSDTAARVLLAYAGM